MRTEDA